MTREYFQAQSGIINPDKGANWQVILIGCGGLGSYIAPLVSKLGVSELVLIDNDTVSVENIAGQNFLPSDIGRFKVSAVSDNCLDNKVINKVLMYSRVDKNTPLEEVKQGNKRIIISAVDSMLSRKDIYQLARFNVTNGVRWLIDPRMGGEIGKIEVCNMLDSGSRRRYESTLHSDSEGMALPCAERLTGYNAVIIAGIVTYIVKQILTNGSIPTTWYNNLPNNAFSLEKYE